MYVGKSRIYAVRYMHIDWYIQILHSQRPQETFYEINGTRRFVKGFRCVHKQLIISFLRFYTLRFVNLFTNRSFLLL